MSVVDTAYGATTKLSSGSMILDLNNGNGAVSTVKKGDWMLNPFKLAFCHCHLMGAALSSCSLTIEGTLDPLIGDGGPDVLFTSDPLDSGKLIDNDTGHAGSLLNASAWIRYNVKAISGAGANVKILVSGDPR